MLERIKSLFIFLAFLPGFSAEALTLTDDIWVGACAPGYTQADCVFDQRATCEGTIDIDKSSYTAGEEMIFTADVSSQRISPSLDPRWCKMSFKTVDLDPNAIEFNTDPQGVWTSATGWTMPYRYGPEMNSIGNILAGTVAATPTGLGENLYVASFRTVTVPALPAGNNFIRVGLMHENGLYVNGWPMISSGWGSLNFTVNPVAAPSVQLNFVP